jgi:hypothetical protein
MRLIFMGLTGRRKGRNNETICNFVLRGTILDRRPKPILLKCLDSTVDAMDKASRAITHAADKYVRRKEYNCLFPGCLKKAIRGHAIPRASCIEALARDGVLYTQRQSFNPTISMTTILDAPEIVEIGINHASVFKGYCSEHDAKLFASAETTDRSRKNGMFISLHLRSLSLEYSRKRRSADFFRKLAELDGQRKTTWQEYTEKYDTYSFSLRDIYLGSIFNMINGSDIDSVEYYCVPFTRNLNVSCCGCFNANTDSFDSLIAFNLISYADMSILALTVFKVAERYLDSFLASYCLPKDFERLVNDIAFSKCEEPLISVGLWQSLSESEKLEVQLSLRPPLYRAETSSPKVIKLNPSDLTTKLTPEMLTRLATHITVQRS